MSSSAGDSSLIKPAYFNDIIKIKVTTLDKIMTATGITRCKLLKLETEGWEPEILQGASKFLRCCEYVAIDGGLERGENSVSTFNLLNNFLMKNGLKCMIFAGLLTGLLQKYCNGGRE